MEGKREKIKEKDRVKTHNFFSREEASRKLKGAISSAFGKNPVAQSTDSPPNDSSPINSPSISKELLNRSPSTASRSNHTTNFLTPNTSHPSSLPSISTLSSPSGDHSLMFFGKELSEIMSRQKKVIKHTHPSLISLKIPIQLYFAMKFVCERGLNEEGLFRVSARATALSQIRSMVDSGNDLSDLKKMNVDVNTLTGFIKAFLRELPTPLIPNEQVPSFLKATELDSQALLSQLKQSIDELPNAHRHLLVKLMSFLHCIVLNNHVNFMSAHNLAIVIGPNIIRNEDSSNLTLSDQVTRITERIIENINHLFVDKLAVHQLVCFKHKLMGHSKSITALCDIKDNQSHLVLSIDTRGTMLLWDVKSKMLHKKLDPPSRMLVIGMKTFGKFIFVWAKDDLHIYDFQLNIKQHYKLGTFAACLVDVNSVWLSMAQKIAICDLETLELRYETKLIYEPMFLNALYHDHSNNLVWSVAYSSNNKNVFYIWDVQSCELKSVKEISQHSEKVISIVGNKDHIWSVSTCSTLLVWDSKSQVPLKVIPNVILTGKLWNMFHLGSLVMFTSADGQMTFWNPQNTKGIVSIHEYHTDFISDYLMVKHDQSCCCSSDCGGASGASCELWTGSGDESLVVWKFNLKFIDVQLVKQQSSASSSSASSSFSLSSSTGSVSTSQSMYDQPLASRQTVDKKNRLSVRANSFKLTKLS